jgi:hypothetical protein
LINPAITGGAVNYAIDDAPVSLQSGFRQDTLGRDGEVVTFDRGVNNAQGRYALTRGSYTWSITDQGWELNKTTFTVTFDNSTNGGDFSYEREGIQEVVPAGGTKTITSDFPVLVRFDRGDNGPAAERALANGAYRVGLTADAKALDLLPAATPTSALAVMEPSAGN